jgi:hypothetical protein
MGSSSSRFIIGAAGFVPLEILQASFEPWLLYLPPTSYVGRRKRRDQRDPDKAGQKEYDISQWLMDWDSNFVLDARTPVSELVSDLRRYYRGEIVTPNSKFTKSALSNLGFPDVSQAGF